MIDIFDTNLGMPTRYYLSGQPTAFMSSGYVAAMNLLHVAMTQLDCVPKQLGEPFRQPPIKSKICPATCKGPVERHRYCLHI